MGGSSALLSGLIEDGAIALEDSPFLHSAPAPLPVEGLRDRAEGMLLGLCVGNALALPTEGVLPEDRRARFGEVDDHAASAYGPAGSMSVDAQLSLRTAKRLLTDGRLDPAALARDLAAPGHIVLGDTLARFVERYNSGMGWERSGAPSAGNGALMRIAPVVLAHLAHPEDPSPDLWADAAIAGMITHNDGAANSACVAFVKLIWDCLAGDVPSSAAWIERYVAVAAPLEPADEFESSGTYANEFFGTQRPFSGTLSAFVKQEIPALEKERTVFDACAGWGSGAYLLETVPSALYILARHGDSFEEAVRRAVNDTWDNDTIACIVGAVMGAAHGRSSIPEGWLDVLNPGGETGALLRESLSLLPRLAGSFEIEDVSGERKKDRHT